MTPSSLPLTRDLVLVGGGHSHALVLRKWAMNPLPGVRVTVINPGPTAPYSGMLPGFVAGHYDRSALDIDLIRLSRVAGARFVMGAVTVLDPVTQHMVVPGRPPIAYDIASIDVGITSTMPGLPGFQEHAVPAKPLGVFASAWNTFLNTTNQGDVVVIGAGVAGAELAMAMTHAMRNREHHGQVSLIDRSSALTAVKPRSAQKIRTALADLGVVLIENASLTEVRSTSVVLEDGRRINAAFVTGAAGAYPAPWLTASGLNCTDGFIDVDDKLRSSDPKIFAVGDCAHMTLSPRPKAGVFAVRQAPVLFENLRRSLAGTKELRPYRPQKDYLKLVSLGQKSALAERFGIAPSGALMWRWKNRIDQAFMDQFRDLPKMDAPAIPSVRAAGLEDLEHTKPLCGGCGAKVGPKALFGALAALGPPLRADIERPAGDDAGILRFGSQRQVISTDHLRGFVQDPVIMTKIAAMHALGDIWSMGAKPQAALMQAILPRMSAILAERSLREITQTAADVFAAEGAEIVGGHSTFGSELTLGFTVTGLCDMAPLTLAGAKPGDLIVLTKPIGTGVVMAAEMSRDAPGEVVVAALEHMTRAQGQTSTALVRAGARAMTDVTGFGLFGHLQNICQASGVGAELRRGNVPLLPGALDLSAKGHRSSLFAENRQLWTGEAQDPLTDLLFDPQTAGGLLAAIPGSEKSVKTHLTKAGVKASVIGQFTSTAGQIDIL